MLTDGVTDGVTVIVAAFEVTVFKPEHEFVEVNAQVTCVQVQPLYLAVLPQTAEQHQLINGK